MNTTDILGQPLASVPNSALTEYADRLGKLEHAARTLNQTDKAKRYETARTHAQAEMHRRHAHHDNPATRWVA